MSMPAAPLSVSAALPLKYLPKPEPHSDSEFYAVHQRAIHGMQPRPPSHSPAHAPMRPSNPPSPRAASTSTSTTPLDPTAHLRHAPHSHEPTGYDSRTHAYEPTHSYDGPHSYGPPGRLPFHGPSQYQRPTQFGPALAPIDSGDMAFPHVRHAHTAQPQLMHSPTVQAHRQPHAPALHYRQPGSHAPANYRHPGLAPHTHKPDRGAKLVPAHRPYDLQAPAPASRTFWNHYETGLLVQLWLEFEPQFQANKRNAGVWAQLAQRLTERSGRHRTVRECRIKWKNMWAKHRDLINASHMSADAKLREFPHFAEFSAIRQRTTLHQQPHANESTPEHDSTHLAHGTPSSLARATPPAYAHGSPGSGLTVHDLPRMLHRLDCSLDCDSDAHSAESAVDSVIERMRALASNAPLADISSAAQQIIGYVERESRRRQQQSDRHHTVVAALADILTRSGASTTAAPSIATSRRSSGAPREWSPLRTNASAPDRLALILHPREADPAASTLSEPADDLPQ
ncbi:hypothetical protein EV180_004924 [Coemansia sp. RSA 518]|nr:hypothetical protein EV180_004924 [Coemansia sp. RSA 518]